MLNYYYNEGTKTLFRQHRNDVITFEMPSISRTVLPFKEECKLAATRILEKDSNIWLGLTGGWLSNIILDSFLSIGFKPNVFVIEMGFDLNSHDSKFALDRCKQLNIEPMIIDMLPPKTIPDYLLKFGNRVQIYSYYETLFSHKIRTIPGRALIADTLNVRRDVHPEGKWSFILSEDSLWATRYNKIFPEKRIINKFFTSSPEILLSFLESTSVSKITDGSINGKLSLISSRNNIFKEEGFDKISRRPVTVGYSGILDSHELNTELIQTTLGYYERNFCFELEELKQSLKTKERIWKFV